MRIEGRIIRDLMSILLILIMPMWLMELLEIDTFLLSIIAERKENNGYYRSEKNA